MADKINYNEKYKNSILNIGDVLLTMTGEVGRIGIVDETNCLLNQRVLKVSSNSSAYTFAYLTKNYTNISSIGKGSVQQNLSVNDLYKLNVIHSLESIKKFSKYNVLIDKYISLKTENQKLNELKQLYLKKFFG